MEDKIEVEQIVKQKTIKEVKSKTIRGMIKEAQCLNNMIFRNRMEKFSDITREVYRTEGYEFP